MPSYSVEQVTAIANTVFAYETKESLYGTGYGGGPGLHVEAANVLATAVPEKRLSWALNIKLGADPTTLDQWNREAEHLIEFAAAFAEHADIRDQFLRRFERDLANEVTDTRYRHTARRLKRRVPGPSAPELRFDKANIRLFHPIYAPWYTPKALVKLAQERFTYEAHGLGQFLGEISNALKRSNGDTSILRDVATRLAKRELAKKAKPSTDYHGLAEAIQLADQNEIEKVLLGLSGVQQALLITLRDPAPDSMARGLRSLASSKHLGMLRFMGRDPTCAELLAANVRGAAQLWQHMPWARLRSVVEAHGKELRAALIRRSEMDLDELRICLSDHPQRYSLAGVAESTNTDLENENEASWGTFKQSLQRYFDAQAVREVLNERFPPEAVRLIALRHLTGREDLAQYVDHLLPDEALYALAAYESPIEGTRGRYAEKNDE